MNRTKAMQSLCTDQLDRPACSAILAYAGRIYATDGHRAYRAPTEIPDGIAWAPEHAPTDREYVKPWELWEKDAPLNKLELTADHVRQIADEADRWGKGIDVTVSLADGRIVIFPPSSYAFERRQAKRWAPRRAPKPAPIKVGQLDTFNVNEGAPTLNARYLNEAMAFAETRTIHYDDAYAPIWLGTKFQVIVIGLIP